MCTRAHNFTLKHCPTSMHTSHLGTQLDIVHSAIFSLAPLLPDKTLTLIKAAASSSAVPPISPMRTIPKEQVAVSLMRTILKRGITILTDENILKDTVLKNATKALLAHRRDTEQGVSFFYI
jgi:hypothetical protein